MPFILEHCLIGKVYAYGEKKRKSLVCIFLWQNKTSLIKKLKKVITSEDNENKSKYIEFINYIIGILCQMIYSYHLIWSML